MSSTAAEAQTNAHNNHQEPEETPLTEAERAAIRAYLQRCEVRISTQHRVATAFIGGAGLLLLIPIFLRDIVDGELSVFLGLAGNLFPAWGDIGGGLASAALLLALGIPLVLSLVIPMYGVYMLLKDLVHFYFSLYTPGFDHHLLNPTFALGGINFSPDESPRVKQRVMKYQYIPEHMDFMMPFSTGKRELYFAQLIEETNGTILPHTRNLAALRAADVIDTSKSAEQTALHFNAAFGIARALDHQLVEEVAVTEMHLVRNVLYLRRLMLRYIKTLLLFIWTTVVSFIMLPMLRDERFPSLLILALGYVAWSVAVMPLIEIPANWIYRHRYDDPEMHHLDAQLTQMETHIVGWCRLSIASSCVALALAAASLLVQ